MHMADDVSTPRGTHIICRVYQTARKEFRGFQLLGSRFRSAARMRSPSSANPTFFIIFCPSSSSFFLTLLQLTFRFQTVDTSRHLSILSFLFFSFLFFRKFKDENSTNRCLRKLTDKLTLNLCICLLRYSSDRLLRHPIRKTNS